MRFVTACFIVVAAGATALGQPVLVESDEADFSVVEIASGLEFPWSIAPIDAGNLLISEREGRLNHVTVETGEVTAIRGLPDDILVSGQGGLLGVAIHPAIFPRAGRSPLRLPAAPRRRRCPRRAGGSPAS